MAQLVEALRYKPKGLGFDSRWCHWNFSLTQSFRLHNGPGVNSASNRNEYREYFVMLKAAGVHSWQTYHLHVSIVLKSGGLNLLESSGPVQACNGIALPKHPDKLRDPPNPLLNEYQCYPGIMWPKCEANHSSPPGSETKNENTSATPQPSWQEVRKITFNFIPKTYC